mmetsp:Transcript_52/g.112  ORF Transcript_52/g.112 Transcript_52/m.112 type:complete len:424 (+) Transcript_52:105-1376(+)|eukprot:CAMPEP_0201135396 /NCGR_PEP_ID=MMETSP0850-20130426/54293_1 /ASSEMBLY_ACC=CAM_ASM_000622 /TAXON_ID=183588 /ORGANISM="Pseudo-nitzschia fraudulenta, Strain WWA7" /LENGTH=423 /DNA_ID=CAMNT_0047406559 /DNA_START=205 /DNA_END=1476 /DNA_ORIENTATION=+
MAMSRTKNNNKTTTAMPSWLVYASILVVSLFLGSAAAQDVSGPICSCSPSKYTFTLDFSLECPPVNVTRNAGISATFCQISPFGDANETIVDLVPVEVGYVDVLELGQGFEVLTQENITGTFIDGDVIEYTSIIEREGNEDIPKVIQLNIFAFNAEGQPIVNFFAIAYSNICDEFPTLLEGESAGWTHFTELEPPSAELCPAAPADGTDVPTDAPTIIITDAPTDTLPTIVDTVAPTDAPTDPDSSEAITGEPTSSPTKELTDEPTTAPITMSMDMSMSMDMMAASIRESLFEWRDIQYNRMTDFGEDMSMSMAMTRLGALSMSMTMDIGLRTAPVSKSEKKSKVAKAEKKEKKTKSEKKTKEEKGDKSSKGEKKAKSAKSEKESKKVKSAKSDKKSKGDKKEKEEKSEKVRRRRRLRVHRVD